MFFGIIILIAKEEEWGKGRSRRRKERVHVYMSQCPCGSERIMSEIRSLLLGFRALNQSS